MLLKSRFAVIKPQGYGTLFFDNLIGGFSGILHPLWN